MPPFRTTDSATSQPSIPHRNPIQNQQRAGNNPRTNNADATSRLSTRFQQATLRPNHAARHPSQDPRAEFTRANATRNVFENQDSRFDEISNGHQFQQRGSTQDNDIRLSTEAFRPDPARQNPTSTPDEATAQNQNNDAHLNLDAEVGSILDHTSHLFANLLSSGYLNHQIESGFFANEALQTLIQDFNGQTDQENIDALYAIREQLSQLTSNGPGQQHLNTIGAQINTALSKIQDRANGEDRKPAAQPNRTFSGADNNARTNTISASPINTQAAKYNPSIAKAPATFEDTLFNLEANLQIARGSVKDAVVSINKTVPIFLTGVASTEQIELASVRRTLQDVGSHIGGAAKVVDFAKSGSWTKSDSIAEAKYLIDSAKRELATLNGKYPSLAESLEHIEQSIKDFESAPDRISETAKLAAQDAVDAPQTNNASFIQGTDLISGDPVQIPTEFAINAKLGDAEHPVDARRFLIADAALSGASLERHQNKQVLKVPRYYEVEVSKLAKKLGVDKGAIVKIWTQDNSSNNWLSRQQANLLPGRQTAKRTSDDATRQLRAIAAAELLSQHGIALPEDVAELAENAAQKQIARSQGT